MNEKKAHNTSTIEKLAEFWQTHDVTDLEEELEEVTEQVFARRENDERAWDEQIERDLEAGRLDALLAEVDKEYERLGKS